MWEDITLPAWAVALLGVFSTVAILDRVLLPGVRWTFRRRANRAIAEINTRLQLRIEPFKLTRRKVLIDRLLYDPDVLSAVAAHATETGATRDEVMSRARLYVREIVPAFSAYTYFHIGAKLARRISRALYRVRLGYSNDDALRAVPSDAAVVFVINHRSNMDYILVTYVASAYSALSYAVGEWAQVWGLRGLIRSMGAYFIRRNSRDALYRKILARYVDMSTKAGVVQAIFPEGGLSRDGALRPPKLGLLSYIVSGFDPQGARDVVFIPVGLNYDRVLEDRVMTDAAKTPAGEAPRFRFNAFVLFGFVLKNISLLLRGAWRRFGYAGVSFGPPISLRSWLAMRRIDFRTLPADVRTAEIERLGLALMSAVGQVVPPLPVSLIATVLRETGDAPLTVFELKGRVAALIAALETRGSTLHLDRNERDEAIDVGIDMLRRRRLLLEDENGCRANPDEATLIEYYAAGIEHLMPPERQALPPLRVAV